MLIAAAAAAVDIPSKAPPGRTTAPRPPDPPDLLIAPPSRSTQNIPLPSRSSADTPAASKGSMFSIGPGAAETLEARQSRATATQSPRPIRRAGDVKAEPHGDGRKETKKISSTVTTNGAASEGWNEYVDIGGNTGAVAAGGLLGSGAEGGGSRPETPRRDTLDMSGLTVTPGPLHKSSSK